MAKKEARIGFVWEGEEIRTSMQKTGVTDQELLGLLEMAKDEILEDIRMNRRKSRS